MIVSPILEGFGKTMLMNTPQEIFAVKYLYDIRKGLIFATITASMIGAYTTSVGSVVFICRSSAFFWGGMTWKKEKQMFESMNDFELVMTGISIAVIIGASIHFGVKYLKPHNKH